MPCLACRVRRRAVGALCERCRRGLGPPADIVTSAGVLVAAAHVHDGPARALVHRLKYDGHRAAARVLADGMVPLVPEGASVLVPIARATARRWRHGIDPAFELSLVVGRRCGLPVAPLLRPRVWYPHRNGPAGRQRGVPDFELIGSPPSGAVLVDDVVTTGTTVDAAAAALGDIRHALAATAARGRSALREAASTR